LPKKNHAIGISAESTDRIEDPLYSFTVIQQAWIEMSPIKCRGIWVPEDIEPIASYGQQRVHV
jgi:hypothetical protein